MKTWKIVALVPVGMVTTGLLPALVGYAVLRAVFN
jgi:hypothetical protein